MGDSSESEREPGRTSLRALSPEARDTARRLVARELEHSPAGLVDHDQSANGLHRACERVVQNVRESMGEDGCEALFGRAFSHTAHFHPIATELRDPKYAITSQALLSAAVGSHGVVPVAAAVETLLAALIDILARLIGEDMAIRIIDRASSSPGSSGAPRS